MQSNRKKTIRYLSIILIIIIITINISRFTMADEAIIAKVSVNFEQKSGEVFSEEIQDYEQYDCSAIIKISCKNVTGIRFKLYYNKAFKIIAAEKLSGDMNKENLDKGIFAITYKESQNLENDVEIYKVYFKKKLKTNNIVANEENLNICFDFTDKDTSEIISDNSCLDDSKIDYPRKKTENNQDNDQTNNQDNNQTNNQDNSQTNNQDNDQTNNVITNGIDNDSNSNSQNTNTIVKEDGTTITTIKDKNAGTITTITTDGTTGKQTTTVEKISSSNTSNKNLPKTGDSMSILSIVSIIILSIIAIISREKSKIKIN